MSDYTLNQFMQDAMRTRGEVTNPDVYMQGTFPLFCQHKYSGDVFRVLKRHLFGKISPTHELLVSLETLRRDKAEMPSQPFPSMTPDVLHAILGIYNEVGEMASAIVDSWTRVFDTGLDWGNMDEEAFDLIWFLTLYCHGRGITLEDLCKRGIAKLKARHPGKFDAEQMFDENRNKDAERKALEGE